MKFTTVIAVALAILMAISKADPPTIEVGKPPNHEVRIKFKKIILSPISIYARGISKTFLGSLVIPQAKLFE